jgi:Uma2 family endonuclease
MRVKIQGNEKYTYPDITVVCGNIELEKIKGVETLLNPIVIMEILSESTEAYDRGTKFRHYRLIPSLQEYILVSQDHCLVELYRRGDNDIWQILSPCTDMNKSVSIASVDCELLLSDIYYRVEFVN